MRLNLEIRRGLASRLTCPGQWKEGVFGDQASHCHFLITPTISPLDDVLLFDRSRTVKSGSKIVFW